MKKIVITYTIEKETSYTKKWLKQMKELIPLYEKMGIVIKIQNSTAYGVIRKEIYK